MGKVCAINGCENACAGNLSKLRASGQKVPSMFVVPKVFLKDQRVNVDILKLCSISDLSSLLRTVDDFTLCLNLKSRGNEVFSCCGGYVDSNSNIGNLGKCEMCTVILKNVTINKEKASSFAEIQKKKLSNKLKACVRRNNRLKIKVQCLKSDLQFIKKQLAKAKDDAVDEAILTLPDPQQEAVRACLQSSKCRSSQGIRYTLQWLHECVLLRRKSKCAYEHLKLRQLLPLPCYDTLKKYIISTEGTHSFNNKIFTGLQEKDYVVDLPCSPGSLQTEPLNESRNPRNTSWDLYQEDLQLAIKEELEEEAITTA